MKLNSWRGTGSDGNVLLTPCVPEGTTGYDDDDDDDYQEEYKIRFAFWYTCCVNCYHNSIRIQLH